VPNTGGLARVGGIARRTQAEVRNLRRTDTCTTRVLSMHQGEWFVITMQPVSDPERLVVLSYSLVEEPDIRVGALPPERCREPVEWLYDELDLDRPEGPRGLPAPTTRPTFRHDILLSNGWEVVLRFRAAGAKRPVRVLPKRAGSRAPAPA
jgi:hypothetical protein